MADDFRTCRRAGCRWPAAASLSYHYPSRQVWLHDLVDDAHPSVWDLCPHHATALTVPRGWERVDQRSARAAAEERAGPGVLHDRPAPRPLTGGIAPRAAQPPDIRAPSRYAALRAELPRLAAQWAAAGHGAPGLVEHQAAREDGARADLDETAPRQVRHRSRPFPSRELAPMVQDTGPAQGSSGVEASLAEIPGQLAIPVPGPGSGVVVHLDPGARRRGE